MIVSCPNCSTKYNLPDANFRPGAKARCTVCSQVFPLVAPQEAQQAATAEATANNNPAEVANEAASQQSQPVPQTPSGTNKAEGAHDTTKAPGLPPLPSKKAIPWNKITVCLFILGLIAGGGFFFWNRQLKREAFEAKQAAHMERIKGFNVSIDRQTILQNDKIGKNTGKAPINTSSNETKGTLYVVEGTITNNFATPKSSIKIAASLLDDQKRVLAKKEQFAGTSATSFQLSVMEEKDLEQYLNDPITIMANNSLVLPGTKVGFTVVFYRLFNKASEIQVHVIDAADPKF